MLDDAEDDARRWGIGLPENWQSEPGTSDEGIWVEHLDAFNAFLAVSSQWRVGGNQFLGLDYSAVKAGFEFAGIALSSSDWADFRLIEAGAREELNRKP